MLSRLLEAHEMILSDAHDAAARVAALGDDGTNDLVVSEVIRTGRAPGLVPCRAPRRHPARPRLSALTRKDKEGKYERFHHRGLQKEGESLRDHSNIDRYHECSMWQDLVAGLVGELDTSYATGQFQLHWRRLSFTD